jgi:DNA-binding CsgD family transcriptional regulator
MWERARQLALEAPPSDHAGLLFLGGVAHEALSGNLTRAATYARQGLDMLESVDSSQGYVELARVAAWPLAETGAAALRAGDDVALEAVRGPFVAMEALAREHVAGASAAEALAELLALDIAEIEAWRARLEGTEDTSAWRALADGWAGHGRPYRAVLARWHEAEAAEAAGGRDHAVSVLRAAHEAATELGARPLLGHLETMARRLRVRLGSSRSTSAAPERAYGLTRREHEVLTEVAAGRTNREIAESLFISESTAGVHVSNILGKLGVSTRTEAARLALDQGLVQTDD